MPSHFKGIRLNDDQLTMMRSLKPHYVDVENDTDMLEKIYWNGLLLTAAQANVPNVDAPLYGGFNAEALAAQLERVVLPCIEFLLRYGRLTLLQAVPITKLAEEPHIRTDTVVHLTTQAPFVDAAADEIDAFGGGFLGDD